MDEDSGGVVAVAEPAEAFGALADPARVAILEALWEGDGDTAFSELRTATEIADSGRFAYHLRQLTDTFVVGSEDGYRLTAAGYALVGAVRGGLAHARLEATTPVPVPEPCGACGGQRRFTYEVDRAVIACERCDNATYAPVPPGVYADAAPVEYPERTERYVRAIYRLADEGFCSLCDGPVRASLEPGNGVGGATDPAVPAAMFTCRRCGRMKNTDLGVGLMFRTPVVAFFADHDVDLRTAPLSRVRATDTDRASLVETAPPVARVHYAAGDEQLTVTVDDALEIQGLERSPQA